MTLCESGSLAERLSVKSEGRSGPYATGLPIPRHQGNAIGRQKPGLDSPGLGHRIEELLATGLLMIWHLDFAIGRRTPAKGHRVHEALW